MYQPMESLNLVVITNKASNILEDCVDCVAAVWSGRCAQNDWRKAEVMRQIGQDSLHSLLGVENFGLPKPRLLR